MTVVTQHHDVLDLVKDGLLSVATIELPELTPDLEIADLGYNSVQTMEFLTYLEEETGVSFSPRSLMTVETLADLAEVVRSAVSEAAVAAR
ncbi:acyl carrier protein [Mycobacterium sp. pUA109]|uniref:acyl carrier protein n=1 Tax=Mycobacterium sp. pUA109 TaxID=3238982 RepID=UPI00351BB264